jgi:hypothetical protein
MIPLLNQIAIFVGVVVASPAEAGQFPIAKEFWIIRLTKFSRR